MGAEELFSRLITHNLLKRKSTIVTPLNWILAIFVTGTVSTIMNSGDTYFKGIMCLLLAICLFFYLYQYNHFAKHDPERLQTEDYRIELKGLETVQKMGSEPEHVENVKFVGPPYQIAGGEGNE